ncbi:MAG TPA: MFS transporter [Rubrobacteraceae bacterium]|nr:MFS transporter [Rubrobacteraceae bacterium]
MSADKGGRRWAALALLCVAQFVDVLDINAVIVALPVVGRDLGFAPEDLQWVITAYVLFFGGFLLLAGRLSDLYGRRRMFVAGLAVFTASSLACGLAGSPLALVVFRAFQGLGAAIVAPAALSIISSVFPAGRERNLAMGVWTAVAAGGGAAGLVLGGLITDTLGWAWIFFVNVPVGVVGIALSFVLLGADREERASRRLDAWGAVTVTAGLSLLVYGLTLAEEAGFGSPLTLATVVLALILLSAFLFVERSVSDPLVPLRVFRSPALSGSALVAFANTAATSSVGVIAVLYLQEVLAYSPTQAGLLGLPFSLSVVVGSFVGSRLTGAIGARGTMALGLLGISGAALLITGISAEGGLAYVLSNAALSGLALGCSAVASTTRGTSAVGEEERGLASGLLNSSAQIGTALGLAALITVAAARTEVLAGDGPATAAALVEGFRTAFYAAAGLAVAGALVPLLLMRGREGRPGEADA